MMHVVVCMQVISHIHRHQTPMLRPGLKQFSAGKMLGICLARLKLRLGLDTTRVRGFKLNQADQYIYINQTSNGLPKNCIEFLAPWLKTGAGSLLFWTDWHQSP